MTIFDISPPRHAGIMLATLLLTGATVFGATAYYVDAQAGQDDHNGLSPENAWRSLEQASSAKLVAGDRLLLKRGVVFSGHLVIQAKGSKEQPVVVAAYGDGAPPTIDAKG
jgi:hypothetical protein